MSADRKPRHPGRSRQTINGQFAPRPVEMLESWAYRVLTQAAHRLLARIEIEFAHHGGNDNGKLPITFDDFHAYGIHRHAIAPGLRELEALGFITWQRGRAGNAEFREAGHFGVTYRNSRDAKGKPTDEWKRIQTIEEAKTIVKDARAPRQTKRPARNSGIQNGRTYTVTRRMPGLEAKPTPQWNVVRLTRQEVL